ncbi:F-type H+-transporting ATPase subunit epsilon [Parelusimicrobium proximum]|uniref:ATP synthase F1 subunit epsilon n=1 Tax=Parelusimicrobium proximum TaxID=3228953 RepID=UPI003D16A53B
MSGLVTLYIYTPEKPVVEKLEVTSVVIPAYEGEMGIMYNHAKAMVQMTAGTIKYKGPSGEGSFEVLGGFAEVYRNTVEVFAEDAALAKESLEEAGRQAEAKKKASLSARDANIDFELAEIKIKKMIAEMKVQNRNRKF